MSSEFFIRDKRKFNTKISKDKKATEVNSKKRKLNSKPNIVEDEEIPSSDEISDVESTKSVGDDEQLTVQDKKLQLAKKYLEEIEREERERLENSEPSIDTLANRLKEDRLSQAGKLRKKIAEKLQTVINESDILTLKCKEHKLSVTCVIISGDSKFIYSASKDGFIVKWDILQNKKVGFISSAHKLKDKSKVGHGGAVLSLAISYDNKYLVSGDVKHQIHVWNPVTLMHLHHFKTHSGSITGLAICKDTNTLYSSSDDRSIKVWNLEEMVYVETLFGHQVSATSIDVLCKDRAVSSGGIANSIHVWKIVEESQLVFNGSGNTIDVVKRIDDNHFVSCGQDGLISVWGISKKKPLAVINNAHDLDSITSEPNWIISLASLSMSDVFASGSSNGCVKLWRFVDSLRTVKELFTVPMKGVINSIAFSSDEKYLVLGVGQEHKLGRWSRIAEAKNSVVLIKLQILEQQNSKT